MLCTIFAEFQSIYFLLALQVNNNLNSYHALQVIYCLSHNLLLGVTNELEQHTVKCVLVGGFVHMYFHRRPRLKFRSFAKMFENIKTNQKELTFTYFFYIVDHNCDWILSQISRTFHVYLRIHESHVGRFDQLNHSPNFRVRRAFKSEWLHLKLVTADVMFHFQICSLNGYIYLSKLLVLSYVGWCKSFRPTESLHAWNLSSN